MKTKKDLSVPVLLSALLFCAFLPGLQVQAETMVRNELGNAESSQSRTAESLDRASDLAGSAERDNQETGQRIEQLEEGNRNLQNSERGDKEIIRECQRILDQVRERGKAQN